MTNLDHITCLALKDAGYPQDSQRGDGDVICPSLEQMLDWLTAQGYEYRVAGPNPDTTDQRLAYAVFFSAVNPRDTGYNTVSGNLTGPTPTAAVAAAVLEVLRSKQPAPRQFPTHPDTWPCDLCGRNVETRHPYKNGGMVCGDCLAKYGGLPTPSLVGVKITESTSACEVALEEK